MNISCDEFRSSEYLDSILESVAKGRISNLLTARPTLFQRYNWSRGVHYMKSALDSIAQGDARPSGLSLPPISSVDSILRRRSRRFFLNTPLDKQKLKKLLELVDSFLLTSPWIVPYVVISAVEGHKPGAYRLDQRGLHYVGVVATAAIRSCLHGMWWIKGSGFAFIFSIRLQESARILGEGAQGYFRAIREIARISQSVLALTTELGLGAWVTPALDEAKTSRLLQITSIDVEPLYYVRIGEPDYRVWEYEK